MTKILCKEYNCIHYNNDDKLIYGVCEANLLVIDWDKIHPICISYKPKSYEIYEIYKNYENYKNSKSYNIITFTEGE